MSPREDGPTGAKRWADAYPMSAFYFGGVSEMRDGGVLIRIVANCQHHHRTRIAAQRCGERILRSLPVATTEAPEGMTSADWSEQAADCVQP